MNLFLIKARLVGTLTTLTLILFMCSSAKYEGGYTISGEISRVNKGQVILAKLDLATNERIGVDTAQISGGRFSFSGSVESPYLHTLFINDDENKIPFFLENNIIEISGDIQNLEKISISGSREDSLFRSYQMDDIFHRSLGMDIMMNHPDYAFAAFTAYYQFQIYNIHMDTMQMIMTNFTEPVQNTVYFKHLSDLVNKIKNVAISKSAPGFSIPDTSGKIVDLADFKDNYVFIDFWASWCAPCRAENPKLKNVFDRFSKHNFTIIGVSVDKDKNRWIGAINKDQLSWINVSNLNGWDHVSDTYAVKAIPQNFLLDPRGVIIAKNISTEALTLKLESVF